MFLIRMANIILEAEMASWRMEVQKQPATISSQAQALKEMR